MILVLVLVLTGALILLAAAMSGTARSHINVSRDEAESLRAEMASEAGMEYARRQLALDLDWQGTNADGVLMSNGSRFIVEVQATESIGGDAIDATFSVTGHAGDGVCRLSSVVRVRPGSGGVYPYALLSLGQQFTISHGMVYGDVLLADRARRINDWLFDPFGDGYYAQSNGPIADGTKQFVCTGVDGTVYKYRDDLPDYQWLGKEVLLEKNTNMPAWDLDEFAVPGPGKTILTNPHNVSSQIWKLSGLVYEDTVVINLLNKQTVTLTNCKFKGGLVVLCPEEYDMRSGARNLVHLKKGTSIGGGTKGAALNIGLIAPGGRLKNDVNPNTMSGFHLVNEVDLFRNSTINGQLVILNNCKDISDCVINFDPSVIENLPPWFGYGTQTASTEVISIYEDFE
jgi:hypothetical protein